MIEKETQSNEIPLYAVFSNHEEFYNIDKAWRTKWSQRIGKHYALNMSHTLLSRKEKNALTLPSFLSLDFITGVKLGEVDAKNLSSTAVETLLTFCPPAPPE